MSSALVHVPEGKERRDASMPRLRDVLGANAANCAWRSNRSARLRLLTCAQHRFDNPELRDVGDSFVRVGALEGIRAQGGHDVVVGLA